MDPWIFRVSYATFSWSNVGCQLRGIELRSSCACGKSSAPAEDGRPSMAAMAMVFSDVYINQQRPNQFPHEAETMFVKVFWNTSICSIYYIYVEYLEHLQIHLMHLTPLDSFHKHTPWTPSIHPHCLLSQLEVLPTTRTPRSRFTWTVLNTG